MVREKKPLFILFFTLLLLTGCANNKAKPPATASPLIVPTEPELVTQDTLLLYKANEGDPYLGDLYIQKGNQEKEKISSDVVSYNFMLLDSQDAVIFIDSEDNMYFKKNREEKQLITSEPIIDYLILGDESGVSYLTSDNNLYIRKWGQEKEKIASDVMLYDFVNHHGDTIGYVDLENNLYIKRKDAEREKIASNASNFFLSSNGATCYYTNLDYDLYMRDLSQEENEKIASNNIYDINVSSDGNLVTYLAEYDFEKEKGEFYIREMGESPRKIASDVRYYQLPADGQLIYYLNEEGSLFLLDRKKDVKNKITEEISLFSSSATGDIVVFEKEDKDLYLYTKNKEIEKISDDIIEWDVIDNDIVLLTKDNNLYIKEFNKEKEKISDNIESYILASFSKTLAYYTGEFEVYIKTFGKDAIKVLNDANNFSNIYFSDQMLFYKQLRIKDIHGIWHSEEYPDFFVEITSDNVLKFYAYGEFIGESSVVLEENDMEGGLLITSEYIDFYNLLEDTSPLYVQYNNENSIDIDYESFIKFDKQLFESELTQQRKTNEANSALKQKVENAYKLADELIYSNQIVTTENANLRKFPNADSEILGTLYQFGEFYIDDTAVDENGTIWFYVTAIDEEGDYLTGWSAYSNFK